MLRQYINKKTIDKTKEKQKKTHEGLNLQVCWIF